MTSSSETHGMDLVQALQRICEIHADSDVEIRDAVKAFEITLCHTIEDLAKEDSAAQYRTVSALRHQIYDLPAKLRIRAKELCADKEKEKDSDQENDTEMESRGDRRDQGLIRRLIDGTMSKGIGIDPHNIAVAVAFERMAEVVTRMGEVVAARNARAFSEEYVTERMATLLYDAEWAAIECRTTVHNAHRRAVKKTQSLFVANFVCLLVVGAILIFCFPSIDQHDPSVDHQSLQHQHPLNHTLPL
eukprot:TRINITY_DN347_c0_g1_i5.p2 TRINITY_DN347_c0_g1~~TRINITY_DN347_c0_g1_i5.p2  ORF type:complete len:246 (+),score=49.66 TRINITY_DN347_c0_g1_i5:56-793(+)